MRLARIHDEDIAGGKIARFRADRHMTSPGNDDSDTQIAVDVARKIVHDGTPRHHPNEGDVGDTFDLHDFLPLSSHVI